MIYKILNTIGKKYTKEAKEILEKIGQVDCLDLSQKEFEEKVKDYDIVLVGLGLNLNKKIIDKAVNLKVIATATTGLDHVDIEYAHSRGVKIISLRGENDFLDTITGTAELAFGLIIDLLRLTPFAFDSVKKYEWKRENFRGHNLRGQTLGVIGLGRLGKMMARYGNAFFMNVLAFDPNAEELRFKEYNCKKIDLDRLLAESDIVSLHVHLNNETENLINSNTLSKMKTSAYLVNTSRGKIVNEVDLLLALENKKIAGYATDVLADELNFKKDFSSHPLVEYSKINNNLIIAPHIGGMTYESRRATDIFIANKIAKLLEK